MIILGGTMDLRSLFSANDPSFTVEEAFTDRHGQWVAVAAALGEHLRHIAGRAFNVEDLEAPRSNLITFHGVGGP
ncbi:hypothetical protein [Streptomyces sp. NPDC054849]